MPINLNILNKVIGPVSFSYDRDTVILYALGIGAGVTTPDFIYEKNLKVFPTFAVVPFMPVFFSTFVPAAAINVPALLHGEHQILLHRPIPVKATVYSTMVCNAIHDKGDKGAVLGITMETRDEKNRLLFENRAKVMDRSGGNFSGDRGPKTPVTEPPKGKAPDFRVEDATSPNQAALYRLSGDKNPLHIDPDFAAEGGFARPILHGLCSFGFAARAILSSLGADDPARLKSFGARFVHVVHPGDTLITEGWKSEPRGACVIQTTNHDGKVILGNACAEIG